MRDFGSIVEHNVGLVWMQREIVLVVSFRGIKGLQGHNSGNNGPRKYFRFIELGDVRLGDSLLFRTPIED